MLGMLNIPRAVLPQVVDTAQVIGNLRPEILGRPIPRGGHGGRPACLAVRAGVL